MNDYLSPEQYATKFNLNVRTVREWLRTRALVGKRFGRLWRIRNDERPKEAA